MMLLKQDDDNLIELEVLRRRWPLSVCSWDGNWLLTRVRARLAGEAHEYRTWIQCSDLRHLLEGLREGPYEGEDCFDFQTLDGGIDIFFVERAGGAVTAEGTLSPTAPHHASANHQFELTVTRAALDQLASGVELTLAIFSERPGAGPEGDEWLDAPRPN